MALLLNWNKLGKQQIAILNQLAEFYLLHPDDTFSRSAMASLVKRGIVDAHEDGTYDLSDGAFYEIIGHPMPSSALYWITKKIYENYSSEIERVANRGAVYTIGNARCAVYQEYVKERAKYYGII